MRSEVVLKHLGFVLLFNAIFLFISFVISLSLNETSTIPLLFSCLICVIFGVFPFIFVEKIDELNFSEGLTIVISGWILTCLIGSLPYIMWGGEFSFINAWFESVSGFTTTGSTILNNIEILPKGLLFWRSATHWIGGVGIIVFILLIIPQTIGSRVTLLNTELSDLSKTNFKFKTRKIVYVLIWVYVGLTLLETISLSIAGMSFFDALNHSFATIATGGFSTKNLSIAYYNSVAIELIIIIFMILSGLHFGLVFNTIIGKRENIFSSVVVRAFVLVLIGGILLVSIKLYLSGYYDWWNSLRHAAFQVVSLGSTTGFATVDTGNWPSFTQLILIYFTIQCAMVGSTSGGLKFDRVYLAVKSLGKQIRLIQHPKAVIPLRMDRRTIDEQLERQTLLFIAVYVATFFMTTLILTSMNVDGFTAFSASITTIGNVGPGFEKVSSMGNFANIPAFGKFVLSINMLLGRLEIFNVFALIMLRRNRM